MKQDPDLAEIIPARSHEEILDRIEAGFADPKDLLLGYGHSAAAGDPTAEASVNPLL